MRFEVSGEGWSRDYQAQHDALGHSWQIIDDEGTVEALEVEPLEQGRSFRMVWGDRTHTVTILPGHRPGQPLRFLLDEDYHELLVKDDSDRMQEMLAESSGASGAEEVCSVMPGIVKQVLVEEGATIEAEQPLLILEAMKMENEIRSPCAGTVEKIAVTEGATVAANDLLVRVQS